MSIFSSFSRIIIIGTIISHVIFSIILYNNIKVYIEKSHTEQFINVVRSTSQILANHAAKLVNNKRSIEEFLDGIQNSGIITFVEISLKSNIVYSPQKQPNTLVFHEDQFLFKNDDNTFFVAAPFHSNEHSMGFAKFGFNEEQIRKDIDEAYTNSLILTVSYLLLLITLVIIVIPRLTSSLSLLNIAAQKITLGKKDVNLKINTRITEFKNLIHSLEKMRVAFVKKNEEIERKEIYIRILMNRMADSMIVLDKDMRIKLLNSAALRCFGYEQGQLDGKIFTSLLSPCLPDNNCAPCEILQIEQHISTENENSAMECIGKRVDGSTFPVKLYFTNFEYENEHIIICNSHDLTERKEAEKKLLNALESAEQSNKAKSIFLSSVSHELRTPLNAIIGYSEILLEEENILQDRNVSSDINRIQKSGQHLLMIINNILDLSKIEAGIMEVNSHEFLVKQLVDETLFTVSALIEKNNNKLTLNIENNDVAIFSDYIKIKQALINLLGNAAKFTKDGDISLNVCVDNSNPPLIVFEVIDTGIGIEKQDINKLFKEFSQANAQVMNTYGGTGLGLIISQKYCELIGGSIKVRSTIGQGSTFTMSLPLRLN